MGAWRTVKSVPGLSIGLAVTLGTLIALPGQYCVSHSLAERPGFAEAAEHLSNLGAQGPLFTVVWPPNAADAMSVLPTALRVADAVPDALTRGGHRLALIGPAGFTRPPELSDIQEGSRKRFDRVDVVVYHYPVRDTATFDLRRDLATTSVFLVGPEHRISCNVPRTSGGFACPNRPDWNHVGPTVQRVEGNDWAGVWVHPVQGHEMVIELGDRQLGDVIELEAALSDNAALTNGGAAVQIELQVDGVAKKVLRRSNSAGIAKLTMQTPHRVASIIVTVRTGKDSRRHLAINLRIIERAEVAP